MAICSSSGSSATCTRCATTTSTSSRYFAGVGLTRKMVCAKGCSCHCAVSCHRRSARDKVYHALVAMSLDGMIGMHMTDQPMTAAGLPRVVETEALASADARADLHVHCEKLHKRRRLSPSTRCPARCARRIARAVDGPPPQAAAAVARDDAEAKGWRRPMLALILSIAPVR